MSNTAATFGFRHIGYLSGNAVDYQLATRLIASSNTTSIYFGDPVVKVATTQYIAQAANNTTVLEGIFQGCMLIPSTGGAPTFSPYYPGAAGADVTAYVMNAPGALFMAAATNTNIPNTAIGENIGFSIGTGSTFGGCFSGATLDQSTISTTNTLPFQIVALYGSTNATGSINTGNFGGVGNGSDTTSAYNWVVVCFNSERFKQLTGVA
jgi:hypothetical protein